MDYDRKDLLDIESLTAAHLQLILDTAAGFRQVIDRPIRKVPTLRGRTIVNLFFEPSTRTRMSFELAAKRLNADVLSLSASSSSALKGETLLDTTRNLLAMRVDCFVIRHGVPGTPQVIARHVPVPVLNAGDGAHEHPTQALLDLYTIREKKGRIKGLTVVIVGDIARSRVARSNIWALTKMGAQVRLCAPPTLIPPRIEETGAEVFHSLSRALRHADLVMMLRIQKERAGGPLIPSNAEYRDFFALNKNVLRQARKNVLIMHPGPVNRGLELPADLADGPHSVILDQVTNGVAVRMAVLYLLLSGRHSRNHARMN